MFHLAFFRKIYVLNSVQSICDSLAIDVYEANARICLEVGDFSEFNQCQSCLRELYITNPRSENKFEFWAYRILYATALEDTKTVLQEQVLPIDYCEQSKDDKSESEVFTLNLERSSMRTQERKMQWCDWLWTLRMLAAPRTTSNFSHF
uniref:Uncharacterized protein n=1 Tax=Lotharella globosa TaxID=91324 RepID=A0A7S4DU19_9EUKA